MANVTKYIDKLSFPSGSDTITANLVDTVSGYTANTGTVTSVGISGTSPISASGTVTTSGTLSVSHEASGVTAKTTAALYPFKVNATGHITEVGTAVTVPTAGTTASEVSTTSSGGSATTWSKSDHVHNLTSSTVTSALGYTPYNSTNPNSYITIDDVPKEVKTITLVESSTPIDSWESGQYTFTVESNGDVTISNDGTQSPVQFPGHWFPISIPAVGAGVGKLFTCGLSGTSVFSQVGVKLYSEDRTLLFEVYTTGSASQNISSSVMASTKYLEVMLAGGTLSSPVSVSISINDQTTGTVLWSPSYNDLISYQYTTDYDYVDIVSGLESGVLFTLEDTNGDIYPYAGVSTINGDSYLQFISQYTDSITTTTKGYLVDSNSVVSAVESSVTPGAYVKTTGDTMTGPLYIQTTGIDVTTAPSENKYMTVIQSQDINGKQIGTLLAQHLTNDYLSVGLQASRDVDGTTIYNKLAIGVKASGDRFVSITQQKPWLDVLIPTNTVICTATSTNPGDTYGGTWELIDKEFTPTTWTSRTVTVDSTNTTSCAVVSLHHGHTIELEIQPVTKVALTDTTLNIATFTPANFGLSGWGREQWFYTFSDSGNAMVNWSLTSTGTFRSLDAWVIQSSPANSVSAKTFSKFNIIVTVPTSVMLDSWCNKFYWKKTAS